MRAGRNPGGFHESHYPQGILGPVGASGEAKKTFLNVDPQRQRFLNDNRRY